MTYASPREIVEDAKDRSIVEAASYTAEGARIVCHVQLSSVPTVYAIIAEFYTAANAMNTACANMIADLSRMAGQPGLTESHEGRDPKQSIEDAKGFLTIARHGADIIDMALRAAQNSISGVGHKE